MTNIVTKMTDSSSDCPSLGDLLQKRAVEQKNDKAYGFFSDGGVETQTLTYGQLHKHSLALATKLSQVAGPGDRALMLFPPGIEFMVAYFACLYAGIIAVPVIPSRRGKTRNSTFSILGNSEPKVGLTSTELLAPLSTEFLDHPHAKTMHWMAVDITTEAADSDFEPLVRDRDDMAFLQYTSGSTSDPKGVMVTHGNLLENSEMIKLALNNDDTCHYVSWVPLYHDMGLIYNVLQSIYLGTSCVLMAPVTFLQRPLLWLKAISQYKAKVAGAPNFAYDLCVERFKPELMEGIDLSHWEIAFNGAEPVRADTVRSFIDTFEPYGFKPEASYPCYGMAEATLLVSGGDRFAKPIIKDVSKTGLHRKQVTEPVDDNDHQLVVGCGRSVPEEKVAIVDPATLKSCPTGIVGEVWVHGANIAVGYWQNPEATKETFQAHIAGTGEGPFLRTGDLGFLDENGELYIAGRLKDVIIIRGENFYPQDIEKTVESAHEALKPNCCAAFVINKDAENQQLVIVQEIKRTHRMNLDVDQIVARIRQAVVREHEITVNKVLLIKTGTIPKTSSGKIQRALSRMKMQNNEFEIWGTS